MIQYVADWMFALQRRSASQSAASKGPVSGGRIARRNIQEASDRLLGGRPHVRLAGRGSACRSGGWTTFEKINDFTAFFFQSLFECHFGELPLGYRERSLRILVSRGIRFMGGVEMVRVRRRRAEKDLAGDFLFSSRVDDGQQCVCEFSILARCQHRHD